MDERAQRRALWLVGGIVAGYAASAACFALAFIFRERWLLVAALLAAAVAFTSSTLVRPAVLGFDRWWRQAPPSRRATTVLLLVARAAVVAAVAWAAFTFLLR